MWEKNKIEVHYSQVRTLFVVLYFEIVREKKLEFHDIYKVRHDSIQLE